MTFGACDCGAQHEVHRVWCATRIEEMRRLRRVATVQMFASVATAVLLMLAVAGWPEIKAWWPW